MYVVTGATGNTGSVVAKVLLASGKKVRGIARNAERLHSLTQQGGEAFAANLTDREALSKAFAGAEAVYVMIPPDNTTRDFRAYQSAVTTAVATALEQCKVKYAVSLSSVGADKPEKTGPVVGLHDWEERLNRIAGLNVLHLRAGYFMENTLAQAGIIRSLNMATGPVAPDLKLPMIATSDIGAAAARSLLKFDFNGHETRELLGERDITMNEATRIIGKAIGKADLKYAQGSEEQVREAMMKMGMSADLVKLLLEMAVSLNSHYMKALEPRNARNTTPTSYEAFVREHFVPLYKSTQAAA